MQCPGVGEWCLNMVGGYICCGANSKEPECVSKKTQNESDYDVYGIIYYATC